MAIEPIRVDYPTALVPQIGNMMELWKKFCGLESQDKGLFTFVEGPGQGDAGYEMRGNPGEDFKETFMITREQLPRLRGVLTEMMRGNQAFDPNLIGFLEFFGCLEENLWPFLGEYVVEASTLFGLSNEWLKNTLGNRNRWSFRFLHYLPGGSAEVIAAQHLDKGTMTPHLGESCGGLEYWGEDYRWHPMVMDHASTLILPGAQMQFASESRVRAVCHRVVQTAESQENGRYSFVVFIDGANTPVYDKQRWGRMQDHLPGFNYHMHPPSFASMFKKVT